MGSVRDRLRRVVGVLRQRFADIERIDFGHAPGRQAAAEAVAAVERRLAESTQTPSRATPTPRSVIDFHNRRWVTRPRPGVDRMASAWLIRRFIDPQATFGFVDQPADPDVPFDMYAGEFSHQGSLCTFEVLAQRFGLRQGVVERLGHVVHDLDMKDARYKAPEGPAIERMVDGLRRVHGDDDTLLEQGIAMFEALARSFEPSVEGHASPRRQRRQRSEKSRRGRKRR